MALAEIASSLPDILKKLHAGYGGQAREHTKNMCTSRPSSLILPSNSKRKVVFIRQGGAASQNVNKKLKEHKASIRCLLDEKTFSTCFNCEDKSQTDILIAKSY